MIIAQIHNMFENLTQTEQRIASYILNFPEKPAQFYARPNALTSAFTNIIENAIKYSDGKEEIEVALYKKDKKTTVFTVQNSGSTVKKEEKKKIFERFYRGENSRSRETGGSGLGLAIAKDLATYNKWKIFAEPTENHLKITVVM